MAVTLYVGNIAWAVSEDDLARAFSKAGNVVEVRIIADKVTHRSRGYGFVEIDGVSLDEAIGIMDGVEIRGRPVSVGPARQRPPRPPRH